MDATLLIHLPIETLEQRLVEAVDAYHAVTTLKKTVEVSQGDRRKKFSESNVGELRAYVAGLQGAITAKKSGVTARRGPIYMGVG